MRRIGTLLIVTALLAAGCAHRAPLRTAKPLPVAKGGAALTRIVVADNAPPPTRYAAEELKRFLGEITGADIPLVSDAEPAVDNEIVVGKNARLDQLGVSIDLGKLGQEGYVLRSQKSRLFIAGGEPRGTLYGVYGLLEDFLGCRWFTPAISHIPQSPDLILDPINESVVPALEYREPFTMDCFDGDWCARNRVNSSAASLTGKHGGKVTYYGFVHTFNQLVPPDKYFDQHPEYFALVKGKRVRENTQLCCTNEDVVRIVTEEVRKSMREHPEAMVFSVSQNDCGNFCTCDKCAALAKAEGSQIAPVLQMVNRVARAVADEFPGKAIDTLAYQWTRKPPKTMRPEPNVIIRLCSIECCFSHSFESCDSRDNQKFVKDVEGWSKMCNRLWVWDYVTSFSHYLTPFPNLRVRGPNIQFFVDHNVTGIFEQDVYTTLNGELSGLSGYLDAKLLWNPDYNPDLAINEFLHGVYGPAAGIIRQYLDLLHDHMERDNIHMNIWIGPTAKYLDGGILPEADQLWDAAEAAVADTPDILERVRVARLSVDYAILERARAEAKDKPAGSAAPSMIARAKRFFEIAERNGVTMYRESNGALADYKKEVAAWLGTEL